MNVSLSWKLSKDQKQIPVPNFTIKNNKSSLDDWSRHIEHSQENQTNSPIIKVMAVIATVDLSSTWCTK